MIRLISSACLLVNAVLAYHACFAYEMYTHFRMSSKAFTVSSLSDPLVMMNLGLQPTSRNQQFPTTVGPSSDENDVHFGDADPACAHGVSESVGRVIACGAMFEDAPGTRSLKHFFDPAHGGRGLSIGVFSRQPSPDWALQDNPLQRDTDQKYSYWWARKYFYNALTTTGVASASGGRDDQWGKVFQSLGQIIHHLQDMTQPQHVRNDSHYDGMAGILGPDFNFGPRHPSRYEKYTGFGPGRDRVDLVLETGSIDAVFPSYRQQLHTPRDFWTGSGAGVADYTNTNFVSQRTNFVADLSGAVHRNPSFLLPEPGQSSGPVTVAAAFFPDPVPPAVTQLCSDVGPDQCTMTFWSSVVTDNLTGQAATNSRAATESVFDEDLLHTPITYTDEASGVVTTSRLFSLNRLNFDTAYPFLIPKAVSYSAGLLNYFFRGQMQIDLPAAGIYSVVDHATENCPDSCGFRLLKLKLTNTTPNEAMTAGNFVAVVKFRRNTCYQSDLATDFILFTCRSAEEEIVISNPIPVATMNSGDTLELPFTFATPVPINATDVFLQVVFQGTLGGEQNAVAVATKDISEPTFITTYNLTDYVSLPSGCFKALNVAASDQLWNQLINTCQDTSGSPRRVSDFCANISLNVRHTGGAAGHEFILEMDRSNVGDGRLPPRRFGRFAVLAERSTPLSLTLGFNNPPLHIPSGDTGPESFTTYQLEEALDGTRVASNYFKYRDINTWQAVAFVVDGTTGGVGVACSTAQLDALVNVERLPVPTTIAGW